MFSDTNILVTSIHDSERGCLLQTLVGHFSAVYLKAIRMLSRETTPAKVDLIGSGVLCPSRTHLAFLVKSILTSQTRCLDAFFDPAGAGLSSSNISKATPTLNISRANASLHIVFPFLRSISIMCSTLVGILIPYL